MTKADRSAIERWESEGGRPLAPDAALSPASSEVEHVENVILGGGEATMAEGLNVLFANVANPRSS